MITIFGSINMDLIATVARLPKPGETVTGEAFATAAGGKGANQALAATRAGAKVAMAGAVGKDGFAAQATELMAEAGTDLSGVKTVDMPTGTATVLVGGDGENMIAVVAGANGEITPDDAEQALGRMSASDYLLLQFEVPTASVEAALESAKRKGIHSVLNVAPLIPEAARLARLASIVIANETEFERLIGRDGLAADEREAALMALHGETKQTIVITLGGAGVIAAHSGDLVRAESLKIEPVDTVGAGDTFCGYLAASLDAGLPFADALRRAAIAGSLACLKRGAQPSIPQADAVEAYLTGDKGAGQ